MISRWTRRSWPPRRLRQRQKSAWGCRDNLREADILSARRGSLSIGIVSRQAVVSSSTSRLLLLAWPELPAGAGAAFPGCASSIVGQLLSCREPYRFFHICRVSRVNFAWFEAAAWAGGTVGRGEVWCLLRMMLASFFLLCSFSKVEALSTFGGRAIIGGTGMSDLFGPHPRAATWQASWPTFHSSGSSCPIIFGYQANCTRIEFPSSINPHPNTHLRPCFSCAYIHKLAEYGASYDDSSHGGGSAKEKRGCAHRKANKRRRTIS